MKILVPFLEKKYNENREEIDDAARQIKVELDKQKNQIFELMIKFYHLLKQMQQVERKYIVINKLIIDEKTVHFFYEYCYLSGDVL